MDVKDDWARLRLRFEPGLPTNSFWMHVLINVRWRDGSWFVEQTKACPLWKYFAALMNRYESSRSRFLCLAFCENSVWTHWTKMNLLTEEEKSVNDNIKLYKIPLWVFILTISLERFTRCYCCCFSHVVVPLFALQAFSSFLLFF